MIITRQPDQLSLLGNLKHLMLQVEDASEEVTMQVWVGAAGASSPVVTHTYKANANGVIDVNLEDIVKAHLTFTFPEDPTRPYQQTGIARTFSVGLSSSLVDRNTSFVVIRGGVSALADSAENFLTQNFLTWQPTMKPVTYYMPEFLTYYAPVTSRMICRAYMSNGTTHDVLLASMDAGTCWSVPVGYQVISGKIGALHSYYDVWVEDMSNVRLTYTQRYYASEAKSEEETWFLFENSLGGIDTFRAYGDSENTASHEHQVATIDDESSEYRVDVKRKYKKNTGYLDNYERRWLLDFFPSLGKYICNAVVRKIIVTDSDVNYSVKELPSEYNFTYQYASTKPYLNLPRTDAQLHEMHIDIPDVASFTIAPRLVEFQRPLLSAGALFPVQNPYSEEWGATTLAELAGYLTDELLRLADFFGESHFLSRLHDDIAAGHITFRQGLTALHNVVFGAYAEGLRGGIITAEAKAELEELWVRVNATIGDGTRHENQDGSEVPALAVKGDSTFTNNLSSPEYVSAFLGGNGWSIKKNEYVNSAGVVEVKYTLEIDNVNVRNILRVYEMIISQLRGENDNRYFSGSMEVDHYDPETGKILLKTGNGKLYNTFRESDLVEVQQYNGMPNTTNDYYVTKGYEMRVTETGIGPLSDGEDRLDWIKFENFASQIVGLTPADAIKAGDTVVRVDSDTDPDRKGIVTMMTVGENTPYMDIIYGLKTDPQRALKSRIGNLEGVRTEDFGWMKNFGIYTNNFYGTGEFRNAQNGESLTAKINTTRTKHTSVYKETTYDITENANHVSNGFFVRELEKWTPCTLDGSAIANQGHTGLLNSGSTPLMVNGRLVSTNRRQQAVLADYEGIPVLMLNGAGVSQSFADMAPNTTHKVMTSVSGTTMGDEQDRLYMGIRILPLTEGTLKVEFRKEGALSEGWQRTVIDTGVWTTLQYQDTAQAPWDFSGAGKMIVSYTGQCMIRFIALANDPVESLKVDYMTRVTQTARLWRVEAEATYSTLTMHSELSLTVQGLATEVTNNKDASDRAKAAIEARLGVIETFDNNTATWITQTSGTIALWGSSFNNDGSVKGLAQLRLDVNGLQSTVGTLATTAALTSYVNSLNTRIDNANSAINSNASAISQTNSSISNIVAQFNANGTLKTSSSLAMYIQEHTSFFDIQADVINFNFTKRWDVYSGSNKVMGLDTQGNLWIAGQFQNGLRINDDGIERWNNGQDQWCDLYASRCARFLSAASVTLTADDDFLISLSSNNTIYLPTGCKDGKVISIKTIGHTTNIRPQSGNYIFTDHLLSTANDGNDLNGYDRAEFVFYNNTWYWNYMSI